MAMIFNANLDVKGSVTLAADKDVNLSGGGEVLGLPATPSGATAAASKAYVDSQISGITGVLNFRGTVDVGAPAGALDDGEAGDYWIVTGAGSIGAISFAATDHLVVTSTYVGSPTDAVVSKVDNTESSDIIRTSSSVTALSDVTDAGSGAIITVAERSKLAGIEAGATADQTGAEIKALYEAEADTNAFTDAEKAKLGHITVTQAVDLDTLESDVAANNAKVSADGSVTSHSDVTDAGSGAIITVAERALVASALQPADNVSELTNDAGYITSAALGRYTALIGDGAATTIAVNHALGLSSPNSVQISMFDASSGEPVFPDSYTFTDGNNLSVVFVSAPALNDIRINIQACE